MAHTPEFRQEAVHLYRVGQRGIRSCATSTLACVMNLSTSISYQ